MGEIILKLWQCYFTETTDISEDDGIVGPQLPDDKGGPQAKVE